jgi:hypothetical protein
MPAVAGKGKARGSLPGLFAITSEADNPGAISRGSSVRDFNWGYVCG